MLFSGFDIKGINPRLHSVNCNKMRNDKNRGEYKFRVFEDPSWDKSYLERKKKL